MFRENLTKPIEYKIEFDEEFVSIEINQVLAALSLVPLGIFLGLSVFVIEIFLKRKNNVQKLKKLKNEVIFQKSFFY